MGELTPSPVTSKTSLEALSSRHADEYKNLGITALILSDDVSLKRPDGAMMIEFSQAATITPEGKTPPCTIIFDPKRHEMQTVRFDPSIDTQTQMAPFEKQGWHFDASNSSWLIDKEHVGVDGKISALMFRPLTPQNK